MCSKNSVINIMNNYAEYGEGEKWFPKDYEHNDRLGFIRKVYAILTIQLSLTCLVTGIAVASFSFRN